MTQKTKYLTEDTQQQIADIADKIAEREANEAPPDPLKSKKMIKMKIKTDLVERMTNYFDHVVKGALLLSATLQEMKKEDPQCYSKEIEDQLDKISDIFANMSDNPEETRSPREIAALPNTTMEIFNKAAAKLYQNKEYDNASAVYEFLQLIDPWEPAFWLGDGHSHYFSRHYDKALEAYLFVAELNPEDPHSHFYASHCYHELNQLDLALQSAQAALEIAKRHPEMKAWADQANALKVFFNEMLKK